LARSSTRSSVISSSWKMTKLADGARAGFQLIAHRDDHLRDGRRPRDRLDDRELAALDAAGNLDFAFAREQRNGAHLAEVHADGIVGLVERARRQVELHLLAALGRPVELLLLEVGLLRVDNLDARAAKRIEKIIELVGRGDLGRQQFVDLVIQQVAFFLPMEISCRTSSYFSSIDKRSSYKSPVARTRHDNR
jgi:hypothetical protein